MEWYSVISIIFISLIFLMATGMPVAFCFMVVAMTGVFLLFGGTVGLEQLILYIFSSLANFTLLPIPLFILMGELMFHTGMAVTVIETVSSWLGRLPGRLSFIAVAAGTIFSTLTGASVASTAILGSVLVPEMEKHGYHKEMTLGPILGSGGLAIMIPPSSTAVLMGAIGEISVGRLLLAIVIPGLLMAALYSTYIITRCLLQPQLAPIYDVPPTPLSQKLIDFIRYVMPLGIIIFLVVGVIFLGIATPSEAAASGCIGSLIVGIIYRKMNWEAIKKSILGTVKLTGMIFLIAAAAKAFSQIVAFTGAASGLAEYAAGLEIQPIVVVIAMQVILLIMGGFMSPIAIMMITLPIFIPVINTLGYNVVWFGAIFLLNMEMGLTTPPLGLSLYVMKGAAPPGTSMKDIIIAAMPFLGCDLVAMALIIAFPSLALWLPGMMR